ncbi:MAG: aminotransferase class V-fold PLP-dependent enzyme, partial [Saprospiraceae bacterium]|nr:aminotransferase class V-fold PLP-dependent enzyme [Saprospiraceae bacterium]
MDRRSALKHALAGTGALALGWHTPERLSASTVLPESQVRDEAYWQLIKSQFRFREGLLYFNNASLGGSPVPVVDATNSFRELLDGYPSKYMWGGWSEEKSVVRQKMAAMINADPDEVALVHNTTEGMNLIASSMELSKGDEIILGNHEHPTARIPWQYYQEQGRGVTMVRPELPLTPRDPGEILEVYRQAITRHTRVISMVHMTNTNGMILPVKEICAMARERGIVTAVDGAQSLAAIPCDMQELGCDYFAASAHKWLFSPKGMGVLFARSDAPEIKPLIANRRYKSKTMI